jgi:hypothetical protein
MAYKTELSPPNELSQRSHRSFHVPSKNRLNIPILSSPLLFKKVQDQQHSSQQTLSIAVRRKAREDEHLPSSQSSQTPPDHSVRPTQPTQNLHPVPHLSCSQKCSKKYSVKKQQEKMRMYLPVDRLKRLEVVPLVQQDPLDVLHLVLHLRNLVHDQRLDGVRGAFEEVVTWTADASGKCQSS